MLYSFDRLRPTGAAGPARALVRPARFDTPRDARYDANTPRGRNTGGGTPGARAKPTVMTRERGIEAVFESGVFKPLVEVRLPEHQRVSLVVTVADDLPSDLLAQAAEIEPGFTFLADPAEDVYTPDDGEPV